MWVPKKVRDIYKKKLFHFLLVTHKCKKIDDNHTQGYSHSTKKPVTTMLTYPWKCTVLHCNHLGNTWKPLVLMTCHFDYCPSASEGDNQSVGSSAPLVSRCFPGGYNAKLYISRGRLAWWLLAFLHSEWYFQVYWQSVKSNGFSLHKAHRHGKGRSDNITQAHGCFKSYSINIPAFPPDNTHRNYLSTTAGVQTFHGIASRVSLSRLQNDVQIAGSFDRRKVAIKNTFLQPSCCRR